MRIHWIVPLFAAVSVLCVANADAQLSQKKKQPSNGPPTTTPISPGTSLLPPDPEPKSCNRSHPGPADRSLYLARHGDSKTAKRVAGHISKYALRRYDMADLFTDAQVNAATEKVYKFLKWKLGGPTPVAAAWVADGFKHFDRAYVDEAAAALLGFKIPKPGNDGVALSPQVLDLIYGSTEFLVYAGGIAFVPGVSWSMCMQSVATTLGLTPNGDWFFEFTDNLAVSTANAAAQIEFNWPQEFDFPNKLIYWDLRARRYGVNAKRQFALDVDQRLAGKTRSK